MPPVITESDRKTDSRGVAPPPWATEPPVWGEPVRGDPPGWEKVRRDLAEMERKKVYRFAYPDGSQYETTWTNESSAKAWASQVGHRYIGPVSDRVAPPPPDVRGTANRGTEPPPSPPPLVKAEKPPPPPPPDPTLKKKTEKPPPKKRPVPGPPPKPEEYTIFDYMRDDFLDTTMKESMPLISKWFSRVGKAIGTVPGLQGVGKGYETVAAIADGFSLLYDLAIELKQLDALEKGSKQLVKRTKPVKKIAEKVLKKKFPNAPEQVIKKGAELLEKLFEEYVTDPAIEEGGKKVRELDEGKELNKPLFEELKKLLSTPPTATPAATPAK